MRFNHNRSDIKHSAAIWALIIVAFGWRLTHVSSAGPAPALQIIPQPKLVQARPGSFDITTCRFIIVSDNPADRFAARLLQQEIRQAYGIDCAIVSSLPANQHRMCIGATDRPSEAAKFSTTNPAEIDNQSYSCIVNNDSITIDAMGDDGLFYGVQTLMQLLEQSQRDHAQLPTVTITDRPTFQWRGRYYDASQYADTIVMKRDNLEREIKLSARYKLNFLQIEVYNLVPFKSFPYCADANTLSLKDWQELVELAHQYHVTLMPSLQSFGQMYPVIWTCDEGKPYREATAGGLICPSRPENVKFLQGLYRDLMTVFKYSPIIGIGCSEVDMQWDKHYCPLCQARIDHGETYYDIFAKHARDCAQAVDSAAKEVCRPVRPMMWADEFYLGYNNKSWNGIDLIPRNMIMGHWKYWSQYYGELAPDRSYGGIAGLLNRGFDVFALSASFEFNTYLHDLTPDQPADGKPMEIVADAGIFNVADQAKWSDQYNQKSDKTKVLFSGCATFSQHDIRCWDTTWFAYALQADDSWGDASRSLKEMLPTFTDNFAATFYQAQTPAAVKTIASAYRDLDVVKNDIERNNHLIRDVIGEYDIHDNDYPDNNLEASLKLAGGLSDKDRSDIRSRAENGMKVAASYQQQLAKIEGDVRNEASLHFLITAAHKIQNHFERELVLLDLASLKDEKPSADLKSRLHNLRSDTQLITDETDELTNGQDGAGYHKVLASLDQFEKLLDAKSK